MSGDDQTITAKSVAMCVLFAASMTLGCLPVLLSRIFKWNSDAQNNPIVQKLLCLGGGVLLCTTFMHLLPEVSEKIEEIDSIPAKDINYAELLMCIGFFTMYFVEECVHACLHRHHDDETVLARSLSVRRGDRDGEKSKANSARTTIIEGPITICVDQEKKHVDHNHVIKNDHDHGHGHSHFATDDSTMKTIRGLFIVLALSVHELFEGLAVGLESSSKNVWYMFGAVSAHKLVIAFCIGVELVSTGLKTCLVAIYVFIFAVVSPLGIGIGIIVTNKGESSTDIPSVFLQGLASGTLLYVVFFEILSSERKSGLKQFLSVLTGFLIMFAIKMIGGD
ncbi:Zip domain containing protein [Asbolus verrucosus]|uniref:Zip domain containing protein n=1 Tax=Asbolus verrucosus TaxID=1661398 RepID=A0A482W0V2_ASBVE|nr:Zip domain containing protein [Asbolus verrucosus]